ncbi:MAG: hypothetical protein E6Q36_00410 [Chryseobacterium sp.]|nr:MAG: hypothetical protein E6Q36_00410 [Chryseobacterium sp.]
MKLNIESLREIVASIVKEELDQTINEAIEKRMRSLAVSLIAESRLSAQKTQPAQLNHVSKPAQQITSQTQNVNKLLKKPQQAVASNIMERVLRDTQQTTLRQQQSAEQSQDELPDEIVNASSKYAELAFASPMPTRSSVMPKPDNQ